MDVVEASWGAAVFAPIPPTTEKWCIYSKDVVISFIVCIHKAFTRPKAIPPSPILYYTASCFLRGSIEQYQFLRPRHIATAWN
mmetsp:Transcript_28300/g.39102  ORF Transcript_28300/g.39102 Transcript_28300/m.39102 type:complete len:83 (-) Transcript_28300:173-421(-)